MIFVPNRPAGSRRMSPALLVVSLLFAFLPLGAVAQTGDVFDKGPKVGEAIPHKLAAADQNGTDQSFESLTGDRGLIILFTRSFDW